VAVEFWYSMVRFVYWEAFTFRFWIGMKWEREFEFSWSKVEFVPVVVQSWSWIRMGLRYFQSLFHQVVSSRIPSPLVSINLVPSNQIEIELLATGVLSGKSKA